MHRRTPSPGFLGAQEGNHPPVSKPLDYRAFAYLRQLMCFKSLQPAAGRSRFVSALAAYFPEVAAHIDDSDLGILHLEIGELKLATRQAIAARDWDTASAHFAFMNGLLGEADASLRDAIDVSYLGNLFYGETAVNYAKARCLLPRPLAEALYRVEQHYEHLVG